MYSNKKTIAAVVALVIIAIIGLVIYFCFKPKPKKEYTGTVEVEPLKLEQFGDITVTDTEAWNELANSLEDENAN